MGQTVRRVIADETDPYLKWGARVRVPFAQVGLIVDIQIPGRLYTVAWIGPTGRPIEGILPAGALTLLANPLPRTPGR